MLKTRRLVNSLKIDIKLGLHNAEYNMTMPGNSPSVTYIDQQ